MRRARWVAFLVCLALGAAACSSSSAAEVAVPTPPPLGAPVPPSTAPPPSTTAVPPPVTAPPAPPSGPASTTITDPSAAVLAAYDTYWAAYLRLMQEPDPASPVLVRLATGRQREYLGGLIQQRLEQEQRLRFPAGSIARRTRVVESITATQATVVVCAVDDSYLLHLGSGAISRAEVQTVLSRVSLVQEDGVWKVARLLIDRTWDGVAGCAA